MKSGKITLMKQNIGKPQPKHTTQSSEPDMTNLSFLAEGKGLDTNSFCATGYTEYMVPRSSRCLKRCPARCC